MTSHESIVFVQLNSSIVATIRFDHSIGIVFRKKFRWRDNIVWLAKDTKNKPDVVGWMLCYRLTLLVYKK